MARKRLPVNARAHLGRQAVPLEARERLLFHQRLVLGLELAQRRLVLRVVRLQPLRRAKRTRVSDPFGERSIYVLAPRKSPVDSA